MEHNVSNDEDDIWGNDLDDLPANTLQDLESKAILSTQHASSVIPPKQRSFAQQGSTLTGSLEGPDGSDYGFNDEDVINLDEPSTIYDVALEPRQFQGKSRDRATNTRPSRDIKTVGQPCQLVHRPNDQLSSQNIGNGHANITRIEDDSCTDTEQNSGPSDLQKRVHELERERASLLKSVEEAKASALSKAGEIAIVRSNHEKASKEYERRLAVIQQLHAEETEKQRRELDVAKKDREKVETTNKFLEHDLAQEAERARQSRRTLKDRPVNVPYPSASNRQSPAATPKRGKIAPFRDGFDDDEVLVVSPSKAKQKSKPGTPKATGKRKRPVENSPIQPLDIDGPPEPVPGPVQTGNDHLPTASFDVPLRPAPEDQRFQFLQRVMNHRPSDDHPRTFEALAHYSFPSKQDSTLASQLSENLASQVYLTAATGFPLKFCRILTILWRQCIDEKLYAPIYLLIDLLHTILLIEPMSLAPDLIKDAVPVIIATVDLVALPIAKAALDPLYNLPEDHAILKGKIDVSACLSVLLTISQNSSLFPPSISSFWQQMEFEFVLLLLHKAQPLAHILLMLQLIATSPLETSFGAICGEATSTNQEKQTQQETALLDRLTSLLIDTPQKQGQQPYSKPDILNLRLQVLDVLFALSITRHGTASLARHRYAIGRLIRFLHDAVTNLYFLFPPPVLSQPSLSAPPRDDNDDTGHSNDHLTNPHSLTSRSINLTTRLLHHLLLPSPFNPNPPSPIRDKIAVIHGGGHKFATALSRLAFSEQLVLEAGVEEATVDAAHAILDAVLSPEEGEAFGRVFDSPERSGG
ncbi:MAG: hypothetical protein M1821_008213 [Bathelium mastoideum]|nr:MAG: hypothetical protein M1821_008213 [Bathelium mastoideum]